MKILIEGEKYPIAQLEEIFDDPKFYRQDEQDGIILSVGYYHSFKNKELVYMLPKVFMKTGQQTIFGIPKDQLFDLNNSLTFKHKQEFNWIRQITVYFYNSLLEFRRRNTTSNLIQNNQSASLNTNLGEQEYSYLDLLLTFVNFYKKNKNNILYKQIEFKSRQVKKTKWEKTIRKSLPLLTAKKQPVYTIYRNKKKGYQYRRGTTNLLFFHSKSLQYRASTLLKNRPILPNYKWLKIQIIAKKRLNQTPKNKTSLF